MQAVMEPLKLYQILEIVKNLFLPPSTTSTLENTNAEITTALKRR